MWRNAEYGIHTNAFVCYACIVRLSWCGSNLFLNEAFLSVTVTVTVTVLYLLCVCCVVIDGRISLQGQRGAGRGLGRGHQGGVSGCLLARTTAESLLVLLACSVMWLCYLALAATQC